MLKMLLKFLNCSDMEPKRIFNESVNLTYGGMRKISNSNLIFHLNDA